MQNDFDSYFVERAKALIGLIEKAMGKPVTDKSSEEVVQAFGAPLA